LVCSNQIKYEFGAPNVQNKNSYQFAMQTHQHLLVFRKKIHDFRSLKADGFQQSLSYVFLIPKLGTGVFLKQPHHV
jgi:hypothetical protein